jgi:DNA-binding MarR family transcriptional regulator
MNASIVDHMAAVEQIEGLLTRMADMQNSPRYLARLLTLAGSPVQPSGWSIITALHRGGEMRVSELAAQLGLDQSTVSRQLKPLDAAGFISRTPDPSDGRVANIALSGNGSDAYTAVRERWLRDLAWFMRKWSKADQKHLGELAARFSAEVDVGRAGLQQHDDGALRGIAALS